MAGAAEGPAWCRSSRDGTFTTRAGDRFGSAIAVLLDADLHADTVFVGAPHAGGGAGAVYVFRRGQESYERMHGLGHFEADGTAGGRGGGEENAGGSSGYAKTQGGTAAGGGWGLVEILVDIAPTAAGLFGSALAAAPSTAITRASAAASSALLLVGSPGWRQRRAEFYAMLPDAGCALVFRRPPAPARATAASSWAFEERLVLSGEMAGCGTLEVGSAVAILPRAAAAAPQGPASSSSPSSSQARAGELQGGDAVLVGAPGLSGMARGDRAAEGLAGAGSGGVAVFILAAEAWSGSSGTGAGGGGPEGDGGGGGGGGGVTGDVLWQRVRVVLFPEAGPLSFHGRALAAVGDDGVVVGGPLARGVKEASCLYDPPVSGAVRSPACLSVFLSVGLSLCLSVSLSLCLSVCLCVWCMCV